MVHPALDPVPLIEDFEERRRAPRSGAQHAVSGKRPVDFATGEDRSAIATHEHRRRVVHLQRSQLRFGLLRVILIIKQHLKLLGHDRRNAARGAHARELEHVREIVRPIESLATLVFVDQTRLLAQRCTATRSRISCRPIEPTVPIERPCLTMNATNVACSARLSGTWSLVCSCTLRCTKRKYGNSSSG